MPVIPSTLAEVSPLSDNEHPVFSPPLSNASFSLDSFGVAGFFGGDSSVGGMATANLIPGRRWVGWYNTPGSYEIAKQYGPLGGLKLCDGLFPEGEHNPAQIFKLDGRDGPPFVAMHSGTVFQRTGHLANIIMSKFTDTAPPPENRFKGKDGRSTLCPSVTIVNLRDTPELAEKTQPPLPNSRTSLWSSVPISVSMGACLLCAFVGDWFCFTSIAVGIVAHGLACFVIGSGKLTLRHPKPAMKAPPGDGVLKGNKAWVILVGAEGAVNVFTRGHFLLHYGADAREKGSETPPERLSPGPSSQPLQPSIPSSSYPTSSQPVWSCIPPQWFIGICALLLMGQFLVQLLLIPLGTLFGQLMFIATVVASWMYNTYLSSINRDGIQTRILFDVLNLKENKNIHTYQLSTFTATVAFTAFVLNSANRLNNPVIFLNAMLPNDTVVWRSWRKKMGEKLKAGKGIQFSLAEDLDEVERAEDKELLQIFLQDAQDAYDVWSSVRDSVFLP